MQKTKTGFMKIITETNVGLNSAMKHACMRYIIHNLRPHFNDKKGPLGPLLFFWQKSTGLHFP